MNRHDLFPCGPGGLLNPGEKHLIECAERGIIWEPNLTNMPRIIHDDFYDAEKYFEKNILAESDVRPKECNLRSEVIRCLVTGIAWSKKDPVWKLHARGVLIANAVIEGDLDLEGCELLCQLWLDNCFINGSVILQDSKTKSIGFKKTKIIPKNNNKDMQAIRARRMQTFGSLFLGDGFRANEEVNLEYATISNMLDCEGGFFKRDDWISLNCGHITVGGGVIIKNICAIGVVDFKHAKIEGSVDCRGAEFHHSKDKLNNDALRMHYTKIGADLNLTEIKSMDGNLILDHAEVGTIHGDSTAWPLKKNKYYIEIDGFTYKNFSVDYRKISKDYYVPNTIFGKFVAYFLPGGKDCPKCKLYPNFIESEINKNDDNKKSVYTRIIIFIFGPKRKILSDHIIDWLQHQSEDKLDMNFCPQPWVQAARTLRESGHVIYARNIAFEREKAKSSRKGLNSFYRAWQFFLKITIGYGYRPQWALLLSAIIVIIGCFTFYFSKEYMVPKDGAVVSYIEYSKNSGKGEFFIPELYTEFNPIMYSLDAFIPAVNLGQIQSWDPSSKCHHITQHNSYEKISECLNSDHGMLFVQIVYFIERVSGWIFVSLFVAYARRILGMEE